MEYVMAVTLIVRRGGDRREDRAMNPRSDVGASEDATIARRAHRGGWRHPHTHRTPAQLAGLVAWWLVIGAVTVGSVIFTIRQSQ